MMCWCRTLVVCTVSRSPTHRARRKNGTYDGNWKKTAWIQPLQKFRFSYHCFVFHIFGASWERRIVLSSVSLSLVEKALLVENRQESSIADVYDRLAWGMKMLLRELCWEWINKTKRLYGAIFRLGAVQTRMYLHQTETTQQCLQSWVFHPFFYCEWMLATNYTRTLNLFKVLLRCLSCLIVPLRLKMIANHKNNTALTYHYTPKTIDFLRKYENSMMIDNVKMKFLSAV